jgi:PAS domain S-box-containing protein
VGSGFFIFRDADKRLKSERLLNEQRSILDTVLNSMTDGVVVADAQGRFKLFNAAAAKLHGRTTTDAPPEDWARAFGFFHLDKQTPYPSEQLPLVRALRGEPTLGAELYLKRPDSEGVFLGINARPIYDEQGLIWGGLAVSRDIGPQKQIEAQLAERGDELERRVAERTADLEATNAELSQRSRENEMFVYSVSHDLRTPLVSLQGFSHEMTLAAAKLQRLFEEPAMPRELADRGIEVLIEDVATSVRFIQSAVLRLSNIIDSLLRLSRAGRVEYQWTEVDLNVVVRRILEVHEPEIARRKATVAVERLPTVWGDAAALEQAFANLIDNSIKYLAANRTGVIRIAPASPPTDDEGRRVLFIEDNGVGIPDQGRQKIFRAFERMHPEHAPGEGIGLAVVDRIVERHRGRVWVESAADQGTRFYLALPAGPPSKAADKPPDDSSTQVDV